MKIAIVHELLIKYGGAERVVSTLLDIYPEADLFTLIYDEKKVSPYIKKRGIFVNKFLQRLYNLGIPRRFLLPFMPLAIESFCFEEYDLVISSSSAFAHGVITGVDTKHICYCHSPARYLWDQTFRVLKEQSKKGITSPIKKLILPSIFSKLRLWDYVSSNRADLVIANSKTVQSRIKKYWNKESKVIFPPVRTNYFKINKEHQGYFLIVSTLSPYKNIDLAIRVFNKLKNKKLIIIGEGSEMKYLKFIAGENIEFLGRKSDEVTKNYMENCRALIFPGEDDFGITPVEAMSCGKPIIALKKGGATETVIENITGVFFEKSTEKSLEDAILKFFETEKMFDAETIKEISDNFSEEAFKENIEKTIADFIKAK